MTPLINKKLLISGVLLFGLIMVLMWFFNRSYIELSVADTSQDAEISYILTGPDGTTETIKSNGIPIKKLVKKGTYQIEVSQSESSSLVVVSTKSFLRSTVVNANLQPERQRQFAGNNPGPCAYLVSATLVSGECNDAFENLQRHVPATSLQPTYTDNLPDTKLIGENEGMIETQQGTVVLLRTLNEALDINGHVAYLLDSNLVTTKTVVLKDLLPKISYNISAYREGFIAYDKTFSEILYYSSVEANPISIDMPAAQGKDMAAATLTVADSTIVKTYNHKDAPLISDGENSNEYRKYSGEAVVYDGSKHSIYKLPASYSNILACGTAKLCAHVNSIIDVYDIAGNKAEFLYTLHNVMDIRNSQSGLLIMSAKGVSRFDVDAREGFMEYSVGPYTICGITVAPGGYVLCIISPTANKLALYVSQDNANSDSIDKKLLLVESLPDVVQATAFGKYIYVTPDYGKEIYIPAIRAFGFDPAAKARVDKNIQDAISKAGIGRPDYEVINTGSQ